MALWVLLCAVMDFLAEFFGVRVSVAFAVLTAEQGKPKILWENFGSNIIFFGAVLRCFLMSNFVPQIGNPHAESFLEKERSLRISFSLREGAAAQELQTMDRPICRNVLGTYCVQDVERFAGACSCNILSSISRCASRGLTGVQVLR